MIFTSFNLHIFIQRWGWQYINWWNKSKQIRSLQKQTHFWILDNTSSHTIAALMSCHALWTVITRRWSLTPRWCVWLPFQIKARICYWCSGLTFGSKCVRSVQQTKKVTPHPLIYIPAPSSTPPLCPPPHLTIFYFEMIKSRDVTMETG